MLIVMNTAFDPWALARRLGTDIRAQLTGQSYLSRSLARKAAALIRALEATLRRALLLMAADIIIEPADRKKLTRKSAFASHLAPQREKPQNPVRIRHHAFQLVESDPIPTLLRPLPPLRPLGDELTDTAILPPTEIIRAAPTAPLQARLERALHVLENKESYALRLAKWQARQCTKNARRKSPLRSAVMPIPKWFDPDLRHDLIRLEISIWQRIEGIDSS